MASVVGAAALAQSLSASPSNFPHSSNFLLPLPSAHARRSRSSSSIRRNVTECCCCTSREIDAEREDKKGRAILGRREATAWLGLGLGMGAVAHGGAAMAAVEDVGLSEWERISLPVDPGVVLLDIAFVPDDPNRGFLLGTRQTLLETKDGGYSWAPRSIPSAEDEDFNYRYNAVSFKGKEGWIVGKPAILLHTKDAGDTWERIPLSAQLPGDMVYIKAIGDNSAEMVTNEGAIYRTANKGLNWKAAVQETVSATLNRTVSSGISGASYYTGTFNSVNRSSDGDYVAVSSRGNFYLTWEPGQPYWQPHNRTSARRIQNMGWRADGGLWLLVRGGGLYVSKGSGITEEFEEVSLSSRGFGILDLGYRSKELAVKREGELADVRAELHVEKNSTLVSIVVNFPEKLVARKVVHAAELEMVHEVKSQILKELLHHLQKAPNLSSLIPKKSQFLPPLDQPHNPRLSSTLMTSIGVSNLCIVK